MVFSTINNGINMGQYGLKKNKGINKGQYGLNKNEQLKIDILVKIYTVF